MNIGLCVFFLLQHSLLFISTHHKRNLANQALAYLLTASHLNFLILYLHLANLFSSFVPQQFSTVYQGLLLDNNMSVSIIYTYLSSAVSPVLDISR